MRESIVYFSRGLNNQTGESICILTIRTWGIFGGIITLKIGKKSFEEIKKVMEWK